MDEKITFLLGDKLPLVSEAIISIVSYSPGGTYTEKNETKKSKKTVNSYVTSLIDLWSRAFGEKFVMTRNAVVKKLRKYIESYGKSLNKAAKKDNLSRRQRRNIWRNEHDFCLDIHSPKYCPMKDYDDEEKKFYIGQISKERVGYISDIVDINYENTEMESRKKEHENDMLIGDEVNFIEEGESMISTIDDDSFDPNFVMSGNDAPIANSSFIHLDDSNMSQSRSGLKRYSDNVSSLQVQNPRPKIRKVRDCTDDIKSTCVQVSVNCGLSANMAILAVKIVCKSLYKHECYLSKDEAMSSDKMAKATAMETEHQKQKTPVTTEDYASYEHVLPSAKNITDYKQLLAIQEEKDAATTLYNMPDGIKCTLHYDTTQRCKIDGDWPAIIYLVSAMAIDIHFGRCSSPMKIEHR